MKKHLGLLCHRKEVSLNCGMTVSHVLLRGRISKFPVSFANDPDIPIIPYGVLARLIVSYYHNKFHHDIDTTVAEVRRDVWIPKVRKIATSVDKLCILCKMKRKRTAEQLMGDLPSVRYEISAAFSAVCMDLFGPLTIKDDCIKKGPRLYKKVWGVVYTCTATRAVYLDVSIDYGTEAVLHTIRRLKANRGDVKLIISDPGSQLSGAAKELKEWRKGWDMDFLIRHGAEVGIEWKFIMPASQHQNGAAESMVKNVKGVIKALTHTIGETILSLNELNTLLAECSNLVNERPIGVKPNADTDPEYLSPNSMLLGRCSERISSGPFQSKDLFDERPKAMTTRFLLVQRIVDQFWKNWTNLYFPTLLFQNKWHHQKRNLAVGDICMLQDSNLFRGEWRICTVTEVYPDTAGVVRNVKVRVAPRHDGKKSYKFKQAWELKRHVGKLIVIVPMENSELEASLSKNETVETIQGDDGEMIVRPDLTDSGEIVEVEKNCY